MSNSHLHNENMAVDIYFIALTCLLLDSGCGGGEIDGWVAGFGFLMSSRKISFRSLD